MAPSKVLRRMAASSATPKQTRSHPGRAPARSGRRWQPASRRKRRTAERASSRSGPPSRRKSSRPGSRDGSRWRQSCRAVHGNACAGMKRESPPLGQAAKGASRPAPSRGADYATARNSPLSDSMLTCASQERCAEKPRNLRWLRPPQPSFRPLKTHRFRRLFAGRIRA